MTPDNTNWIETLAAHFTDSDGIIGGSLLSLVKAENAFDKVVLKELRGYIQLMDCFLSFYGDTLLKAEHIARKEPERLVATQCYILLLFKHKSMFSRYRACERLLLSGYPFCGVALLRDLKDQALFLAALASTHISFPELYGGDALPIPRHMTQEDYRQVVASRKKVEARARDFTIGGHSGLDDDLRTLLKSWSQMFNDEVHGSLYTWATQATPYLQGREKFQLMPSFELKRDIFYANRSCEVAWMVLRTLPYIQLEESIFGEEWATKWRALDDSFRFLADNLLKEGVTVERAVIELVETTFCFSPESTRYSEP